MFMATKRHEDCLEVIDRHLLSDRAPENSMGLSEEVRNTDGELDHRR
jgi:hypothetical protein